MTAVYSHDKECRSVGVVSDHNDYTYDSIVVFLEHLIKSLVSSDVARSHIWPDGPSSQFKNHYIASVLPELESTFCTKIIWNFFATSHRKCPVDAIRGIVKCQISTRIMQLQAIVQNAELFYKCALEFCTGVNIYYIPSTEIAEGVIKYQFENAPVLTGISTMHEFSVNCFNCVKQTILLYQMEKTTPLGC